MFSDVLDQALLPELQGRHEMHEEVGAVEVEDEYIGSILDLATSPTLEIHRVIIVREL